VPEAAVDKYRDLRANEGHVGPTSHSRQLAVNAVSQSQSVERRAKRELTVRLRAFCILRRTDADEALGLLAVRGRDFIQSHLVGPFEIFVIAEVVRLLHLAEEPRKRQQSLRSPFARRR
jgi:hypothetical protein